MSTTRAGSLVVNVRIFGDDIIKAALKRLDEDVRRKALVAAVRRLMLPALRTARENVRSVGRHQTIARSLAIEVKRGWKYIRAKMGPRTKFMGPKGHRPAHTAHLVEHGTRPHIGMFHGHAFAHPGTRAHPFLEPARRQMVSTAPHVFRAEILAAIQRVARRSAIKKGMVA